MNVKELRPGNLLRDRVSGELLEVDYVSNQSFGAKVVDRSKYPLAQGWQAEPIPLDEKWLLDFGWKYYNGRTSGDLTKDTDCRLDIDFIGDKLMVKSHYESIDLYRDLRIKYVHQLQNLFLDLGEELIKP